MFEHREIVVVPCTRHLDGTHRVLVQFGGQGIGIGIVVQIDVDILLFQFAAIGEQASVPVLHRNALYVDAVLADIQIERIAMAGLQFSDVGLFQLRARRGCHGDEIAVTICLLRLSQEHVSGANASVTIQLIGNAIGEELDVRYFLTVCELVVKLVDVNNNARRSSAQRSA